MNPNAHGGTLSALKSFFLISCLIALLVGLSSTLGHKIGSASAENQIIAMLEDCLSNKDLTNGMAECDNPNFMVRETPRGLKIVVFVDKPRSDLRYIPNEIIFALPYDAQQPLEPAMDSENKHSSTGGLFF